MKVKTIQQAIFPVLILTHILIRFAYNDIFQIADRVSNEQMIETSLAEGDQIMQAYENAPVMAWIEDQDY